MQLSARQQLMESVSLQRTVAKFLKLLWTTASTRSELESTCNQQQKSLLRNLNLLNSITQRTTLLLHSAKLSNLDKTVYRRSLSCPLIWSHSG
jgi:hypothetical protein